MKKVLLLICLFARLPMWAQTPFPDAWVGVWEGDLSVLTASKAPVQIRMRLTIREIEESRRWGWTILYLAEKPDERAYELVRLDSAAGHYLIDEKNSIELDAYLRGNTLISRFEVEKTLLDIVYSLEGDLIRFQVFPGSSKAVRRSGKKAEGVKWVDSFPVSSYQLALLKRVP